MKKLLSILFIMYSISSFGQNFPSNPTQGNASTNNVVLGAWEARKGITTAQYSDTSAANSDTYVKGKPNIIIGTTGNILWQRNSSATQWIRISGNGTAINVISYSKNVSGDSTILVLSDGTRYAAKDSTGGGGGSTDTTVAKFPLYVKSTVGQKDSIGVYGVDSSFQNAVVVNDTILRLYRFNGDSSDFVLNGAVEGYIPLVGTTLGKEVVGDIYFGNSYYRIRQNTSNGYKSVDFSDENSMFVGITDTVNNYESKVLFDPNQVTIRATDPTSQGLSGEVDFSTNYQITSFVQKGYVDQQIADSVTGKFIPRAGTASDGGGPVTGDVEVADGFSLKGSEDQAGSFFIGQPDAAAFNIPTIAGSTPDIQVLSNNPASKGLTSSQYFPNKDPNTYAQMLDLDSSGIQSIVAGSNITVDNTDPLNPVVSSSGGGSGGRPITEGFAIDVDSSGGVYNIKADTNLLFQIKDSAMKLRNSEILPGYKAYMVNPQLTTNYESPMELLNIGNNFNPSSLNHTVKTGVLKNNWALASTFNMVYDLANSKWISPVTSVPSMCMETGVEGISLHAVPAGTHFSDTWHVLFQARPDGVTGTTGFTPYQINQSKTTMYWKYGSGTYTSDQQPWVGGTTGANNPFIWMHSEEPKGIYNEYIRSEMNDNFASGSTWAFKKSRGTYQTKTTSNSGDFAGLIAFSLYDGSNFQRTTRIGSIADAAATTGVVPQSFIIQTSATDSAAIATRFRVYGNGQISMGASAVNSGAALDIQSTDKGVLLSRLNTSAINAISSPAAALVVYNTDSAAYFYYDGASWVKFSTGGGGGTGITGGTQSFAGNKTWSGLTTFSNAANITYSPQVDQVPALKITTTLPAGTVSSFNAAFDVRATSINQTSGAYGINSSLLAGATDAMFYSAGRFSNEVAGTGTTGISTWAGVGNKGIVGIASATTTGYNAGGAFDARGGNVNVGVHGFSQTTKNSATNIGVIGYGINAGTSPIQIGGYFGLHSTTPTFVNAALIADNGAIAAPIALFRDNGTVAVTIADGGAITSTSTVTSTQYRLSALNTAPASATDTGTLGEIRVDANFIYVCTATNTWVRSALVTW